MGEVNKSLYCCHTEKNKAKKEKKEVAIVDVFADERIWVIG
jgi:hypothetical protein